MAAASLPVPPAFTPLPQLPKFMRACARSLSLSVIYYHFYSPPDVLEGMCGRIEVISDWSCDGAVTPQNYSDEYGVADAFHHVQSASGLWGLLQVLSSISPALAPVPALLLLTTCPGLMQDSYVCVCVCV